MTSQRIEHVKRASAILIKPEARMHVFKSLVEDRARDHKARGLVAEFIHQVERGKILPLWMICYTGYGSGLTAEQLPGKVLGGKYEYSSQFTLFLGRLGDLDTVLTIGNLSETELKQKVKLSSTPTLSIGFAPEPGLSVVMCRLNAEKETELTKAEEQFLQNTRFRTSLVHELQADGSYEVVVKGNDMNLRTAASSVLFEVYRQASILELRDKATAQRGGNVFAIRR